MATEVFLLDSNCKRGAAISELLKATDMSLNPKNLGKIKTAAQIVESSSQEITIVAHADFLKRSLTRIASLMQSPKVTLILYCTNADDRSRSILLIPDDLGSVIQKINSTKMSEL